MCPSAAMDLFNGGGSRNSTQREVIQPSAASSACRPRPLNRLAAAWMKISSARRKKRKGQNGGGIRGRLVTRWRSGLWRQNSEAVEGRRPLWWCSAAVRVALAAPILLAEARPLRHPRSRSTNRWNRVRNFSVCAPRLRLGGGNARWTVDPLERPPGIYPPVGKPGG